MPPSATRVSPRQRPQSAIIDREVYSDPSEDLARDQARMAEAIPSSGPYANMTPTSAREASNGSASASRSGRRQDFSNEKFSKKDNKLGDYFLGKTLGAGEFAKVRIGWKMENGIEVAVKLISRAGLDNKSRLDKVEREISILRTVNHPNIIKMHEIIRTERIIGIVMEFAHRGELFEYIAQERWLKDSAARRLFAQLVSGVGYLHKNGIIHRDLKLENLLLDRHYNLVITDFGFANSFDPVDILGDRVEQGLHRRSFIKQYNLDAIQSNGFRRGDLMMTSCGSPCYAAPELVVSDGIYTGRKVDVWSCGVILYAMLAGYLPFDDDPSNPEGDNINLLYKYIVTAPLVFPDHVTPHARDLLRRILVPDPRQRADLFEVARHSWLSEYAHVVESVTSGAGVAAVAGKVGALVDGQYGVPPPMTRSASLRESSKVTSAASPVGGISSSKHGKTQITQDPERKATPREAKRRTVQLDYLPAHSQLSRPEASQAPADYSTSTNSARQGKYSSGSELQRTQPKSEGPTTMKSPTRKPLPPSAARPLRDPPRAVSDSNAISAAPILSTYSTTPATTSRPPTQGSMNGTMAGTSRLPQRGSYGSPSAATVAPTNIQGRISQPPPSRGKLDNMSTSPIESQPAIASATVGTRPVRNVEETQYKRQSWMAPDPNQQKHKRNSTFGGIGDRLFGRSNSRSTKDEKRRTLEISRPEQQPLYQPGQSGNWTLAAEQPQPQSQPQSTRRTKADRMYPPSSMRPVNVAPAEESAPRRSTESRRSFGFSRKSIELPGLGTKDKRTSRRFSFIRRIGSSHGKDQDTQSPISDPAMQSPAETTPIRPGPVGAISSTSIARDGENNTTNPNFNSARTDGTFDMDPRARYEQYDSTYARERPGVPAPEVAVPAPIQQRSPAPRTQDRDVNRDRDRERFEEQKRRSRLPERDQRKRYSAIGMMSPPSNNFGGQGGEEPKKDRKQSATSRVVGFFKGRRTSQAV